MALIIKDRIKEVTTTTGTGTITLAGASTGFRSFADIGNANTTYYTIAGQGTNEWEVGLGTYTASGTTLSRDTVLSNSLGTTALINFSAGTKDVFVTYPSEKALLGSTSSVSSTGTGSVVLATNPTITGGATIDATTQAINIGNSQTSGAINIGGTGATGTINLGRSTSDQTINVGPVAGADNNANTTINIAGQTRSDGITTINIGNANISGDGQIGITIGSSVGSTTNMQGPVYFNSPISTTSYIETAPISVADLLNIASPIMGSRTFVYDSTTTTFNSSVGTGGGSFAVPVFYNGSNWRVG